MFVRRRARGSLVAVAAACFVLGTVLLAPQAAAAPGDSSAVGFDADFHGTMATGDPVDLVAQRGATLAPPDSPPIELTGADTAIDVTLGEPLNQDVQVAIASAVSSSSSSSAGIATAQATASDVTIMTPAGPLVFTSDVSSSVSCPYNQP